MQIVYVGKQAGFYRGRTYEPGVAVEIEDASRFEKHPLFEIHSEAEREPGLTGKNKAELLEIADAEGVAADDTMTNAAIRKAIEAAR